MEPLRVGVLASGEGTTMYAVAEAAAAGRIPARVVLVATDRPQAPALQRAQSLGLPTLVVLPSPQAPGAWEEVLASHLRAARCDLVLLAGFLRILRGPLLDAFPGRIVNLHPSLLPKYGGPGMYGTKVHAAVLASGDPSTGSTVHLVTKDVDRGPTIAQSTLDVRAGETAEELSERQKPVERELLVDTVRRFATGELPLPWHAAALDYAAAGVDTRHVRDSLRLLLRAVRYRAPATRGRPIVSSGYFAGVIRIGDSLLALTTDNVGTKVLLAQTLGRWEEVGEDMVAMNVNDLLATGSLPSALVDYIACRVPDGKVLTRIGMGLNRGLSRAGCSLLGGETAVVPDLLSSPYDLSATALGFFPPGRKPIDGSRLRPGDVLIGLASSGFHTNGYTLVRRLVEERRIPLRGRVAGVDRPLGEALLAPTRTYGPFVEPLLRVGLPTALANITGGAFSKNLLRIRKDLEFCLDQMPSPRGLFEWVSRVSGLSPEELYRTFNMGIGFVVAVRAEEEESALRLLRTHGARDAQVIGHVGSGKGVVLPSLGVRYSSY